MRPIRPGVPFLRPVNRGVHVRKPLRKAHAYRTAAGLVTILLMACLIQQPAAGAQGGRGRAANADTSPSAERLAADVTGSSVYQHLAALQSIADTHGGNRGYDRPGFTASAHYVAGRLKAAGYHVVEQTVPYTDFEVTTERLVVGDAPSREVPVLMTRFAPSSGPSGITAPLASPSAGTSGCSASDYQGTHAKDAIVVIGRAACGFGLQEQVAATVGARAVLMYYPTPSPQNIYRLIAYSPFTIPMASVSQRDGELLARQAALGGLRAHLTLRARSVPRRTVNVLAETAGGDPHNVVMIGGHLDSVTEGPGVNDNGTTAMTVLQIALALAPRQHEVRNKVRFAFWGAEELVDVGSDYYVSQLSADDKGRIAAVLNGELLASPNYGRFVWDPGSGGSHAIADLFAAYFDRHGLPYERVSPDSVGSDHLPFEAAGIPVGGIDGGTLGVKTPEQQRLYGGTAGQMFDPCYHQPCDRLGDINQAALDANVPAFAWVVAKLAADDTAVRTAAAGDRNAP